MQLRRRLFHFAMILAGFAALTAILFMPVLGDLSTSLLGPPEDNLQDFWNSWYAAVGWQTGNFFFTSLIRFPEGVSLFYHSFAYPQVGTVWALSAIFGRDIATLTLLQNLTILASFPLGAVGAFYLCRHLSGSSPGGALGGFVFAFNPWHVEQTMHHAHVSAIEFLPFFVLSYFFARERKSLKWLTAAILLYALSALSCWYYLFYGLYFLIFDTAAQLCRHRKSGVREWKWVLGIPVACSLGMALILSPLLVPMISDGLDKSAYLNGADIFVADLLGYITFPPIHLLAAYGADFNSAFTGQAWEVTVYLGLVNLALMVFGILVLRGMARETFVYSLGVMLTFMILASGEVLHIGGAAVGMPLPDLLLSKLPFFANVRTPARAMVFVYMFLGVGVALTIAALCKRRAGLWIAGVVAALMLLDFLPVNLETTPMICAPELAALQNDPGTDFGVLDLPDGYIMGNYYMAQQACHNRPIVLGSVARQLKPTLGNRLDESNTAALRAQLTASHVKYILMHRPGRAPPDWSEKVTAYSRGYYDIVADGPNMVMLKVY